MIEGKTDVKENPGQTDKNRCIELKLINVALECFTMEIL